MQIMHKGTIFYAWLHIVGTSNYIYSVTGLSVSERLRLGSGLYIYYGSSFIKASYLTNKYDLGSSLNANVSAWSVLFSHFLTDEREQYKSGYFQKLMPNKNYSSGKGGGVRQIALQFSEWSVDNNLIAAAALAAQNTIAAKKSDFGKLGFKLDIKSEYTN